MSSASKLKQNISFAKKKKKKLGQIKFGIVAVVSQGNYSSANICSYFLFELASAIELHFS